MKLFAREDHIEGMRIVRQAYVTVGRQLDSRLNRNGFYVMLRSPFVTKNVDQINPLTFESEMKDSRKTYRWACRRLCGNGKWIRYSTTIMVPVT